MTTLTIEHLHAQIDKIIAERRAERAAKAEKPEDGFQDYFGRTHKPAKRDSERGYQGKSDGTVA